MDFKQLQMFVVLAEELHFARTAGRCHMTASAVTRAVQRLEEEVGVALLLRNNRRVELTAAGRQLADFAGETLQRWRIVEQGMQQHAQQVAGQLRLYGSATAGYVLSALLSDFRQLYPNVELQLHSGDQAEAIERIREGREDIAIAALPSSLPEVVAFKTLRESPLCFIMPADEGGIAEQVRALQAGGMSWQALFSLPLIVSERGLARERLNHWLKKQALSPNIYAQVSGHEAIVTLVALGFGIGLAPRLVIEHSPFRDKIAIIDDAPQLEAFQIGLCALKSRLALPLIRAFWDLADPVDVGDYLSS